MPGINSPMPGISSSTSDGGASGEGAVESRTVVSGPVLVPLESTTQTIFSEQMHTLDLAGPPQDELLSTQQQQQYQQQQLHQPQRQHQGTPLDDIIHAVCWSSTLDSDVPANSLFLNWPAIHERMLLQSEFDKHRVEVITKAVLTLWLIRSLNVPLIGYRHSRLITFIVNIYMLHDDYCRSTTCYRKLSHDRL